MYGNNLNENFNCGGGRKYIAPVDTPVFTTYVGLPSSRLPAESQISRCRNPVCELGKMGSVCQTGYIDPNGVNVCKCGSNPRGRSFWKYLFNLY